MCENSRRQGACDKDWRRYTCEKMLGEALAVWCLREISGRDARRELRDFGKVCEMRCLGVVVR